MLSATVGLEIRRRREAANLTRDQVAQRCKSLGWPELTSTVLHYIETGRPDADGRRRRDITVDEVVALAHALDLPPLVLLAPLDDEFWPGVAARLLPTATAIAWLQGARRLDSAPDPSKGDPVYAHLRLYVEAADHAEDLRQLLSEWAPTAPSSQAEEAADRVESRPPDWVPRYEAKLRELRDARRLLRELNHKPPILGPGLEWVDSTPAGASDG